MNKEEGQELMDIMDEAKEGLKAELSMRKDLSFNPDDPENDYWSEENLEKAISRLEHGQEMVEEEIA